MISHYQTKRPCVREIRFIFFPPWVKLWSGARLVILAFSFSLVFTGEGQAESYTFTTFAGYPGYGSADGLSNTARFYNPNGVAADGAGYVYVADRYNQTIRKLTPTGIVSTLAGSAGFLGTNDATGSDARFNNPSGTAVDGAGN